MARYYAKIRIPNEQARKRETEVIEKYDSFNVCITIYFD